MNEDDLKLAIRLCFQSILPDHRTFVGYVDLQPTPSQQGGADDVHLLLIDHPHLLSQLPSLVVIEYDETTSPPVMKAIESESITPRQQMLELLGLRDPFWAPPSCRLFFEGALEIHGEPFRMRGWQRLDLQLRTTSCNGVIDNLTDLDACPPL